VKREVSALIGIGTQVIQSIASHYTDCAIPAGDFLLCINIFEFPWMLHRNNADGGGEAEGAVAAQGSTSALDTVRAFLRLPFQHGVPNDANSREDSEDSEEDV
jgi:hypothetical protein